MKRKSFVKLNFILAVIFLVFLLIILIAINPFQASVFVFIVFYIVFFGLILAILNLISTRFKIPFWIILLISIAIVFILMVQSCRL